jgi:hypothetical protein
MRICRNIWVILACCLGMVSEGGCRSLAPSFGPPKGPGPELSVTQPTAIVGGQPSHWTFSWTKGAGGPYDFTVAFGFEESLDSAPWYVFTDVVSWSDPAVSTSRLERDFVLPNTGSAPLTYVMQARVTDRLGVVFGLPGYDTYNGYDYVSIGVVVQPAP